MLIIGEVSDPFYEMTSRELAVRTTLRTDLANRDQRSLHHFESSSADPNSSICFYNQHLGTWWRASESSIICFQTSSKMGVYKSNCTLILHSTKIIVNKLCRYYTRWFSHKKFNFMQQDFMLADIKKKKKKKKFYTSTSIMQYFSCSQCHPLPTTGLSITPSDPSP